MTSPLEAPLPCPHCGRLFAPPSSRVRPACGGRLFVRTDADGHRLLLTEEQVERQDLIAATESYGQDFGAIEAELKAKSPGYTSRDVYWAALNRAAVEAIRTRDWSTLNGIYRNQAHILFEAGKPFEQLAREASRAALRNYEDSGREYVTVAVPDRCGACAPDAGRHLRLADEMREPTIPHMACAEGFCRCVYSAVVKRPN